MRLWLQLTPATMMMALIVLSMKMVMNPKDTALLNIGALLECYGTPQGIPYDPMGKF